MKEFRTVLQPATPRFSEPLAFPSAAKCEFIVNIGLFFDGTDNNHNVRPANVRTNISKLSEAYRSAPEEGSFRYYVSGVGTPFSELGKKQAEALGGTAGLGGEARIVYGLLQVINSIHRAINDQKVLFQLPALAALCSSARVPNQDPEFNDRSYRLEGEQKILDDLRLPCGLVAADRDVVTGFFSRTANELRDQVTARGMRPKLVAIYLDVFGFSRGAAQARVFVSWLHEYLLLGGQLCGVPAYVRMLGLFDTVASVGVTGALGSAGHNLWAQEKDLRIHPQVRNCVHYVALHELRTNFPLDSVAQGESLPPNCQEHHCPGAHSDVGGGYAPGEQGKGVKLERMGPYYDVEIEVPDADDMLSNLTLKCMYDAAVSACRGHVDLPWLGIYTEEARRPGGLWSRFGLDGVELVRKAVATYFETCGVPAGLNTRDALRQHGLRYLRWRYQRTADKRDGFAELPSVRYAHTLDPGGLGHYLQGQRLFRQQIELLEKPPGPLDLLGNRDTCNGFNRHAGEIYQEIKKMAWLPAQLDYFFDAWVHDSYAGFIAKFQSKEPNWVNTTGGSIAHAMAEGQRYMRWRELYQGSSEGLNARLSGDLNRASDPPKAA